MSVLALLAGAREAAQLLRHVMQAVADSQDRFAKSEDTLIGDRCIVGVNGKRPTAQDDADRRILLDLIEVRGAGQDDGKDLQFAQAARNQLRVLRAKVEDDDGLMFHAIVWQKIRL